MIQKKQFDVIIVGGSYAGLAAGMALGRALRKVLIIDSGRPCNRQTPHSHNFLTQDGSTPKEIASIAKKQLQTYANVQVINAFARGAKRQDNRFEINTDSGEVFTARKLIFATGIEDLLPIIPGIADCWGISVLHCPYCHGYEVRDKKTGILGNGDHGYEFSSLISNWTTDLTLFTNGKSSFTSEQQAKLRQNKIEIVNAEIESLQHENGCIKKIIFSNGNKAAINALYVKVPFVQHCKLPQILGCELNTEGYIKIDGMYSTTVSGVYACGDNVSKMRTVANAVSMGTATGILVNKQLTEEDF